MNTPLNAIEHLADGEPVALPYAYAGHHRADSAAASPIISMVYGIDPAGHPYRPSAELALAQTEDGAIVAVAVDRMAHLGDCGQCAPIWDHYRKQVTDLPAGAMITAGAEIDTRYGPGMLLIDATDLPDDHVTDVDDDHEG